MERTHIADTVNAVGRTALVKGWVRVRRDHGKLIFIDLRDRTGILQIVFNPHVSEQAQKKAGELRSEDVVEIIGKVNKRPEKLINPKIATGSIELEATDLKIITRAETLPFDMGAEVLNLELPTLLDYRSLTLRHPSVEAIFQIQTKVLEGFRMAAEALGCREIVVPTIVASATEGGAEVFTVDYYDHKVFLSQSPQLYKQMMVPVFERVYTIAHAYRAEPSVTTRHLAETTQMDCELGFVDFEGLLEAFEKVAVTLLRHVEKHCGEIFKTHNVENIAFGKIPRLKVSEAQEIIYKDYGRDARGEKDLSPQDEVDICAWAREKHGSDLVTITHFPTAAKPFYTMPDPKNPELSLSYDVLFRGLEIMSGSQRIHDYQKLVEAIKQRGMKSENFAMYLQAFKYGMPPEGGFSFGLERITMKILQLANVREASLFPRDMERVDIRLSHYEEEKTAKTNKIRS